MREWSRWRPWFVVGLVGWLAIGVLLVDRANRQGLIANLNVSPYHLVGYAAVAVLGVVVLWRLLVALRRRDLGAAFPAGYEGLGIGFGLVLGWVVIDPLWQATLGINPGFENVMAPPRLLVPLALVVLATGPLREALAAARTRRGLPGRPAARATVAAGVAALGFIGGSISLIALNPVSDPWNDYVVDQGIDMSEIWVMASDGSAQRRLLPAKGDGVDYSLPAWSPDGRRIAFTTWTNAPGLRQNWLDSEQTSAIWTMAADGTDRVMVVDGAPDEAWMPSWSPDGEWLAYTLTPSGHQAGAAAEPQPNGPAAVGPAVTSRGARTWIVHPDGTGAVEIAADDPEVVAATWSPDGQSLAYIRGAGVGSDVFVARLSDGRLVDERAVAPSPAEDWAPAWSPDGNRIAFTSDRSGNPDVWVVGVDGGDLIQLTDDGAADWAPTWSPDGSTITFVSNRSGDPEIWSMPSSGGAPTDLSNDPGAFDGQGSVSYAPDGRSLAYARAGFQPEAASGFVRWELATAQLLLLGVVLGVLAVLLVALGTPFGGFAAVLTIMTLLAAFPTDQWRFVPGAFVAGAVVDALVGIARPRARLRLAATAYPALAVLGVGFTIGFGNALAWSLTMLLGVATAAGLLGWGLAAVVERISQQEEPAPEPRG